MEGKVMLYADITKCGLHFKNMISAPAPIGRILNYIKAAKNNQLKHQNGNRNTQLKEQVGDSWTTEFMMGLGIINVVNSANPQNVTLTKAGEEIYDEIKNIHGQFKEGTQDKDILDVYETLQNNGKAIEVIEKVFKNSVVFENLAVFFSTYGYKYNVNAFYKEYFSELNKCYSRTRKLVEGKENAGFNRVTSLTQLCLFLGMAELFKITGQSEYTILFRKKEFDREEAKVIKHEENDNKNILLYGIPGCGKSHKANCEIAHAKTKPGNVINVVFHPEYTYQDFVGQIMPKIISKGENAETKENNNGITYEFIPGPFTIALEKAYHDENEDYFLIIDEINRGNAPAIFGEIFQLLDRNTETGESEYGIDNQDVADIIYKDINRSELGKDNKVRIPRNLTIVATMNTGDQNVFRLDTAFKRRWSLQRVYNDFGKDNCASDTILFSDNEKNKPENEEQITWKDFASSINNKITELNSEGDFSEDKGLGAYFVTKKECGDSKAFGEKVLMYLWNDVFRYNYRSIIFKKPNESFDDLLKQFNEVGLKVFKEGIIKKS